MPFTHTAKSSSTVFVALLSLVWLQEELDRWAWLCIGLLISGITLATCTEVAFSTVGLLAGLTCAFSMSVQVVGSKALLREGYAKTEVYFQGMLVAFVVFLPLWLAYEGPALLAHTFPEASPQPPGAVGP